MNVSKLSGAGLIKPLAIGAVLIVIALLVMKMIGPSAGKTSLLVSRGLKKEAKADAITAQSERKDCRLECRGLHFRRKQSCLSACMSR